MTALLCQHTAVTLWPSPLILANTAVAGMVWDTVTALDTALVAPRPDPVFGTLTPATVLLRDAVITFVIQTTDSAQLTLPVEGAAALGT